MNTRRNSMRHPGHDYTQSGAYFITICAHQGRPIFGHIDGTEMVLNPMGEIADHSWQQLTASHSYLSVHPTVVMPNHLHALVHLHPHHQETSRPPIQRAYGQPIPGSISTLVGVYKSMVTKRAMQCGLIPGPPVWHRNFWDHIVQDEEALARIQAYIRDNPARWADDQLHPKAAPNQFKRW